MSQSYKQNEGDSHVMGTPKFTENFDPCTQNKLLKKKKKKKRITCI
jgi:hypothetical protein